MKIINVNTQEGKNTIYSTPDSCILRNNENFYMPEFSQEIEGHLALVIKIKKIGKNIGAKFSSRYYDEISAGIKFVATDLLSEIKKVGKPWDAAVAFDYSNSLGNFIQKEEKQELNLYLNNKIIDSLNTSNINIDQIISEVSHLYTLKIGDLIFIYSTKGFKIEISQTYSSKTNDTTLLNCAIK